MPTDFAARVEQLVALYGSVNACAKAIGIPQSTLDRIVRGERGLPRTETLQRIADFFSTSVDWLISGRGEAPQILDAREEGVLPPAELLEWRRALDRLELDAATLSASVLLPTAMMSANFYAGFYDDSRDEILIGKARELSRKEYRAWLDWLALLVEMKGHAGARAFLNANVDLPEGGFRMRVNVSEKERRLSLVPPTTTTTTTKRRKR